MQSASRHNASFINEDNTLRYILTPEGRALPDGNGGFEYQYFLKDHLGNTRVTFAQTGTVLQEDSYYPFGMAQSGLAYQSGTSYKNKYLYNGKELQDDFGLGWYVPENFGLFESLDFRGCSKNYANLRFAIFRHYGARFYDAELGRWYVLDNLADKYFNLSPYSYAANNPILFIDPDGHKIVIGNNTGKALTNLAQIAATSKGRQRLNRLISSRQTYTTRSTFWSSSSAYDGNGQIGAARTVYYVGSAWQPYVDGGAMSSMYAMGHELNHAYDHDVTGYAGTNERKSRETSSVNFTNYLRSVYGDGNDMRTHYSGLGLNFSDREGAYNSQNEKVTDFTQTLDVSAGGNTFMGFSYKTSTKGEEAQTFYVISVKTESGEYAYRVFDNQKEYDAAIERIQNLKNKEDEKK